LTLKSAVSALALVLMLVASSVQSLTMRASEVKQSGGPDQISIVQVPIPEPKDKQVLLKVYCSAINRADTLQRQGKYPPPPGESSILGLEAAGTVEKLGSGATKWKIGDRVMALLGGGGNAEFVAVHEDHLLPVHSKMTFQEAAAIPEVWLTAFQLLHFVAHVKAGETVLIHAGGSGVGTAAVQLVKLAGARAIVTAGTQEKIDFTKNLGASDGFNYKKGSFAKDVLDATGGRGVDVILDCVGGSMWEQNVEAIATEGRWIMYGTMGGANVDGNFIGRILQKRLTVIGSTLRVRSCQYKSELISAFGKEALPHFHNGTLRTIISSVLPLDDLAKAHAIMESNVNTGKIVIQVIQDETVNTEL
jgi:tumor protein p53-inducible protein 3